MVTAFIDINMFLIGIFVVFYLYTAVDMIYKFSTTGVLPREESRKRMKHTIIFLVIFALTVLIVYVILQAHFSQHQDHHYIEGIDEAFAISRAVSMMTETSILIATIWKLKRAKVSRSDSGHLNLCDATILLILQLTMTGTGLASAFLVELR